MRLSKEESGGVLGRGLWVSENRRAPYPGSRPPGDGKPPLKVAASIHHNPATNIERGAGDLPRLG